jgi:hypothetical protein
VSEPLRIQVGRSRPVCPFCKDELAGGLVWVCPICAAGHHAECQEERRGCASCDRAPPRPRPPAFEPAPDVVVRPDGAPDGSVPAVWPFIVGFAVIAIAAVLITHIASRI